MRTRRAHAYLFLCTKAHNPAGVYSTSKGWKLLQAVKGFGPKVEGAISFLLTAQHLPFDSIAPALSSPPSYSLSCSFSTAHAVMRHSLRFLSKKEEKDISEWCKWAENVFLLLRKCSYSAYWERSRSFHFFPPFFSEFLTCTHTQPLSCGW